jgi:hypothetical protein
MFSQLGPIEICCDAPPYAIVEACGQVGFESPLDVRWCKLSHFLASGGSAFGSLSWKLFGGNVPKERACSCGQRLPVLEKYTFMFASEKLADYLLGQCHICRTIFWEDT